MFLRVLFVEPVPRRKGVTTPSLYIISNYLFQIRFTFSSKAIQMQCFSAHTLFNNKQDIKLKTGLNLWHYLANNKFSTDQTVLRYMSTPKHSDSCNGSMFSCSCIISGSMRGTSSVGTLTPGWGSFVNPLSSHSISGMSIPCQRKIVYKYYSISIFNTVSKV